jgi:histidinol dehydrogenase
LALAPMPEDADRSRLPAGFAEALERAIVAVERFHAPQARTGYKLDDGEGEDGIELEELVTPLRRVGVYVPGGRAAYPSTVVMTVVPARVAGVREIAVATPPGSYRANPALRYTLERLGIEEIWGMGGAHAVAALAYGTETIERVDKIVGPGNAWVTAAKKLVFGDVAIDGIAGPSEILVICDETANAQWVAADLLSQAEHDEAAYPLCITTSHELAQRIAVEVEAQLASLPRKDIATASVRANGAILVAKSRDSMAELADRIGPEHLAIHAREPGELFERIGAAGAAFVGPDTPEAAGDYLAGPSHVLPTGGAVRYGSPLGVYDFIARTSYIEYAPSALEGHSAAIATLARAEGLEGHARATEVRSRRPTGNRFP